MTTTGLIVGKFLPVHAGHAYLLEFAQYLAGQITTIVENTPGDPIPAAIRCQWLQELAPNARIEPVTYTQSQTGDQFWQNKLSSVLRLLGSAPDYLFDAQYQRGWELARLLGSRFVPVDRSLVPAEGARILADPLAQWECLPVCVRPYFVRRVCVFGPESTGKSTLTTHLAKHFRTVAVPEYARTYLDARSNELLLEDFPLFASGQLASEKTMARRANRVLFCDTDALITKIWSERLYGTCSPYVNDLANQHDYDLYLVTDVDVPWVADPQRYLPEERQAFLDRCIGELKVRNRRFTVISGDWETRFKKAVQAVEKMLSTKDTSPAGSTVAWHVR